MLGRTPDPNARLLLYPDTFPDGEVDVAYSAEMSGHCSGYYGFLPVVVALR
ncbi:MAG: hypothetical protein R3B47_03365 [Bacteroidia bacterium]